MMAVPQQYIFRIAVPYTKTPADIAEITNDQTANLKWKEGYVNFKENIRTYLKLAQNGRCAFCRCIVDEGTSESNLDHLLHKKRYPQFTFIPENLVYSCWKCNKSKGQKNSIANLINAQQPFPNQANDFIIINPYYDDFQNHLDFIDDVIIIVVNNSLKGNNTIRNCGLARPKLAETRARELQLIQQTVNQNLLNRLTQPNLEPVTMAHIQAVIALIPTWTLK